MQKNTCTTVILVMAWKSLWRIETLTGSFKRLIGGLGAVIFVISDLTILQSISCTISRGEGELIGLWEMLEPYANTIIMVTYYTAQLFITISSV